MRVLVKKEKTVIFTLHDRTDASQLVYEEGASGAEKRIGQG